MYIRMSAASKAYQQSQREGGREGGRERQRERETERERERERLLTCNGVTTLSLSLTEYSLVSLSQHPPSLTSVAPLVTWAAATRDLGCCNRLA